MVATGTFTVSVCVCVLAVLPALLAMRITQERLTTIEDSSDVPHLEHNDLAVLMQLLGQEGGAIANEEDFTSTPLLTQCSKGKCQICKKGKLLTVCVNAAILKNGFSVEVTVNGKKVYHKDITVPSPPPLCIDKIPGLDKVSKLCVELTKVDLKQLSACAKSTFSIKVGPMSKKVTLDLGCFKIPTDNGEEDVDDVAAPLDVTSQDQGTASLTTDDALVAIENLLTHLDDDIEIDMDAALTGCSHGKCEYCTHGKFLKLCVQASYLAKEVGFQVTVTANGHKIYHNEISVANPPPVCLNHLPFLKDITNVCIQVYDVNIKSKSGCVKVNFVVKIGVLKKKISMKVGCFHIPMALEGSEGVAVAGMEGSEVVPLFPAVGAVDTALRFEPTDVTSS